MPCSGKSPVSYTHLGYIAYVGTVDLEELMAEDPVNQYQREQGVQMGGMA